jgi:CspA family cold shock protein
MTGTIKRLHSEKGFGFLLGDDNVEYFFHRSAVQKPTTFEELNEKQKVIFNPTDGTKGPRAEKIYV